MTKNLMMVCEAKLVLEKQGASTGKIEATVTTWGAREGADGRRFNYQPEGFMQWAKEFASSGRPLPMFVNHDADAIPVGEWTAFEFDDTGMKAEGRLYMNTTMGSDLYKVMQESPAMFGGVSVGAYAEEYQMVDAEGNMLDAGIAADEGYFQITKGGLREVSIVMQPNNLEANIKKLESCLELDGTINPRNLESALRDAGVSKQNAAVAVSVFKGVMESRRDADKTVALENDTVRRDAETEAADSELLAALAERDLLKKLNQRIKG